MSLLSSKVRGGISFRAKVSGVKMPYFKAQSLVKIFL